MIIHHSDFSLSEAKHSVLGTGNGSSRVYFVHTYSAGLRGSMTQPLQTV
ncbi:hypothetical protein RSAG8_12687, partial [Rhizoctonia solani AG-8 WAC10335]